MQDVYEAAQTTKQAHHQKVKRRKQKEELYKQIKDKIIELRQKHPAMGGKKLYKLLDLPIGRDKFLELYNSLNLGVYRKKNYTKTTISNPTVKYRNIAKDRVITGINQVWVADITYLPLKEGSFVYLHTIMDVYSRRIIGYYLSKDLSARASHKALKLALKTRKTEELEGLIHHSDYGVQYTSKVYMDTLKKHKIRISMTKSVYENSHIERLNGILKQEYLNHYQLENYEQSKKLVAKSIKLYNNERPHQSLNYLSPVAFEKSIKKIGINERIHLTLYSETGSNNSLKTKKVT